MESIDRGMEVGVEEREHGQVGEIGDIMRVCVISKLFLPRLSIKHMCLRSGCSSGPAGNKDRCRRSEDEITSSTKSASNLSDLLSMPYMLLHKPD